MGRQSNFLMSANELNAFLRCLEKRGAYFVDFYASALSIERIVSGEVDSFHIGFPLSCFQTRREMLDLLPEVRRIAEPKSLHQYAFHDSNENTSQHPSDQLNSRYSDVIEIYLNGQPRQAENGQKVYSFSDIRMPAYDPPAWLQKEYDYIVRKMRREAEMRHEYAPRWYVYVYPEIAEEVRRGVSTIVKHKWSKS